MKRAIYILLLLSLSLLVACGTRNTPASPALDNDEKSSNAATIQNSDNREPSSELLHINTSRPNQIKNVIEIKDKLIFLFLPHGAEETDDTFTLEVYEIQTGALLYSLSREDYPELGELLRIDKELDVDGYDYRMIFDHTVVYRNSNDHEHNDEIIFELPGISPVSFSRLRGYGNFDISDKHIVYANDEGIWLADRDGANNKMIIENCELSEEFPDVLDGMLAGPRFMDGGSKIVVGVYRTLSFEFTGAISYDLDKGSIECKLNVILPDNVIYPVGNKYIVGNAWGSGRIQKLDITSKKMQAYQLQHRNYSLFASFDYETIIVAEYGEDFPYGMRAFACRVGKPDDEPTPLLYAQDGVGLRLRGITEHYVMFSDDNCLTIVKYQ